MDASRNVYFSLKHQPWLYLLYCAPFDFQEKDQVELTEHEQQANFGLTEVNACLGKQIP